MPPPLTGIRVLDLSTIVAGPTASMVLADLGADVIKVERIDGGDDGRSMGPHRGPWGAFFVPLNRGKRSIAIDVTKPAGRDIILRLASTCDVFVENFRGGKAAALGLDESAIRARKPDIIYASLTAYGARGPDYTKPGYDALAQARSGIVSVTGTSADAPIRAGVSIIDMGAGVWIALGVLAALFERQRSGRGQRIDSSLFQTGVMLMSYHLMFRQFTGVDPKPQGSRHTAFAPYGAFPTATGAIMIGISNDRQFRRLCEVIGKPELADDPRFQANPGRVANVDVLEAFISEVFRTQPAAHWVAALDAADVPNDAVQKAGEVLDDPQLAALHQLARVELPGEPSALVPGLPIDLSLTPSHAGGSPPSLSQHSRAILHEAGYSDAEMEELAHCGACKLA
ncbi:MAG TPA: CoA transferase [Bryobacteraceae bacterium]|nr:CoA transferase [Bryobacteraceae bacterium]